MYIKRVFVVAVTFIFFFILSLSISAHAGMLEKPTVEYSADTYFVAGPTTITGRIYQTPTKRRGEMIFGGRKNIVIVRSDLGLTWTLMVEQKMYMEHAKGDPAAGAQGYTDGMYDVDVELTKLGKETINGIKTNKSRVVVTDKDGKRNTGHMWMTKDGILVKYVVDPDESTGGQQITMELKNLDVAPQSPRLFEVPPGYTKMGLPAGFGSREPMDKKKMKKMMEEMEKRYGQ